MVRTDELGATRQPHKTQIKLPLLLNRVSMMKMRLSSINSTLNKKARLTYLLMGSQQSRNKIEKATFNKSHVSLTILMMDLQKRFKLDSRKVLHSALNLPLQQRQF